MVLWGGAVGVRPILRFMLLVGEIHAPVIVGPDALAVHKSDGFGTAQSGQHVRETSELNDLSGVLQVKE